MPKSSAPRRKAGLGPRRGARTSPRRPDPRQAVERGAPRRRDQRFGNGRPPRFPGRTGGR